MTVRISKPEFNLREKISELDKPSGIKGNELLRSETTQEARDLIGAGRRNLIINGDMRIWQRSGGAAVGGAIGLKFGPDRWMFEEGCGQLVTVLTRSTSTPPGQGFKYSFQLSPSQVESALDANDFAQYMYFVEGYDFAPARWGTVHAKPCTLSFWFKTSMGGQHYVCFNSFSGVDTWSTSITSKADVWERHVITVPPPMTGTWNTTNSRGLEIRIGLMKSGSVTVANSEQWYHGGNNYYGFADAHSNWAFDTSNNAYLTGVQLEIGSQATEFEHRSLTEEMVLCHRYYQQIEGYSDLIMFGSGRANGANEAQVAVPLTVPLRASPSIPSLDYSAWGISNATGTTNGQPTVTRWFEDSSIIHLGFPSSGLDNARTVVVSCRNGSTLQLNSEI